MTPPSLLPSPSPSSSPCPNLVFEGVFENWVNETPTGKEECHYDPRFTEWYQGAKLAKGVYTSKPHYTDRKDLMCKLRPRCYCDNGICPATVVAAVAMFSDKVKPGALMEGWGNDTFEGVMGISIRTSPQELANIKTIQSEGFLIDRQGMVLASTIPNGNATTALLVDSSVPSMKLAASSVLSNNGASSFAEIANDGAPQTHLNQDPMVGVVPLKYGFGIKLSEDVQTEVPVDAENFDYLAFAVFPREYILEHYWWAYTICFALIMLSLYLLTVMGRNTVTRTEWLVEHIEGIQSGTLNVGNSAEVVHSLHDAILDHESEARQLLQQTANCLLVDTDGDGKVSEAELKEFIEQADLNGDGQVSETEVKLFAALVQSDGVNVPSKSEPDEPQQDIDDGAQVRRLSQSEVGLSSVLAETQRMMAEYRGNLIAQEPLLSNDECDERCRNMGSRLMAQGVVY